MPTTDHEFSSDEKPDLAPKVLQAFLDVLPQIGGLVKESFQGREAAFEEKAAFPCVDAIQRYLSWGIVPSTIIHQQQEFVPDAVLLINAAYLFYLEGVAKLIERIKPDVDETPNAVSQRGKWGSRVEQWTLKALEDLRLPTGGKAWGL